MTPPPPLAWADQIIELDAESCYRLLCDVGATAAWVPGVASVRALATDDRGRITRAEFVSMPSRASVAYTLRYEYDDERRAVRWHSDESARRGLTGEARAEPLPGGRTRLVYGLSSSVSALLPAWAQLVLHEDEPGPLVAAFKRWAERRAR